MAAVRPSSAAPLPAVFGRYLLLRRLSRGGMGEIFLARIGEMQGFEKTCIIKKVLPELAADQEFIQRFIEEAQIAVRLQHANIASVYEVGRVETSGVARPEYFLAIEYVEGRDLRRTLARCQELSVAVPPQLALSIVCEVAKGLAHAHRRTDDTGKELGIVHCDISPPNVMLSLEGEVKIIDFGVARSRAQMAAADPGVGFGKFGYMAPEQIIRGRSIDRRTDVYSCGVMLWELLTGARLYSFKPNFPLRDIARTIASGNVARPSSRVPGLDPDFDALVARALAPDPRDRFQVAEDLRDALQRKLYQVDPTFSSDLLGQLVRQLFEDEIEEERAFLKAAAVQDLAHLLVELNAGEAGTLSFARSIEGASFVGPLPRPPRASSPPPELAERVHSETEMVQRPPSPRRSVARLAAAGGLVVLLGGGAVFALRPSHSSIPAPAGRPAPLAAPPSPAAPVVSASAREAPVVPGTARPQSHPIARPARPKAVTAARARSPAEVEARFRAVRAEYDAFKKAYGARLETQWRTLVEAAVYGRGDEKYSKLDLLIADLRREMAQVKGEHRP